jgi:hypothetical protein
MWKEYTTSQGNLTLHNCRSSPGCQIAESGVDGSCSLNHFQIRPHYHQGPSINGKWVAIPAHTTAPQSHWRDSESCNKHTHSHMPPMGIFFGPCLWELLGEPLGDCLRKENHLGTVSGRRATWELSQEGEPLGDCLRPYVGSQTN